MYPNIQLGAGGHEFLEMEEESTDLDTFVVVGGNFTWTWVQADGSRRSGAPSTKAPDGTDASTLCTNYCFYTRVESVSLADPGSVAYGSYSFQVL